MEPEENKMGKCKDFTWETKLFSCLCNGFHFLQVSKDKEVEENGQIFKNTYLEITCYPQTFKDKLKAIWEIVRNGRYNISEDIMLDEKTELELIEFLQKDLVLYDKKELLENRLKVLEKEVEETKLEIEKIEHPMFCADKDGNITLAEKEQQ
jgi:hypothetical protein